VLTEGVMTSGADFAAVDKQVALGAASAPRQGK
jgi:hypothetical protein